MSGVVILRIKAELDRRGRLHSGAVLEGSWCQVSGVVIIR